jgi:hypothetical protein
MNEAPRIVFRNVSAEDQQTLWLVNSALSSMERFVSLFGVALHLFEYCSIQASVFPGPSPVFSAWKLVAARDSVMSTNHFMKEMIATNDLANTSQLLVPHLDRDAMGDARTMFDREFPDYAKLRHAVAHAGELAKTAETFAEHAFSGDYVGGGFNLQGVRGVMIQDGLSGRTYTCTVEGKIVHSEISEASFLKLHSIMGRFFEAFRRIPSPIEPPRPAG